MPRSEKDIVNEFFYNGYTRVWPGATPQQMLNIYCCELDRLFAAFASKENYYQEFARDYRLAAELRSKVPAHKLKEQEQPTDGQHDTPFYAPPTMALQPYTIYPSDKGVVFKYYQDEILTISFRKFFNYLEHYIKVLRETFPEEMSKQKGIDQANAITIQQLREDLDNPRRNEFARRQAQTRLSVLENTGNWDMRLEELRAFEWSKFFKKVSKTVMFWKTNEVAGNPNATFTGSKKLALHQGDLVSFKQLDCADTLTSLTADALSNYTDLEVLGDYVHLRTLALRHMHIKDISFVANLTALDELILYNNEISDITPLANLPKLNHLYLVRNPIKDLSPLKTLPNLRTLFVDVDQVPTKADRDALPQYVTLKILKAKLQDPNPEDHIPKFTVDLVEQRKPRGHRKSFKGPAVQPAASAKPQTPPKDPNKLEIRDRYLYSGITNSLGHTPAVRYDIIKLKNLDCSNTIELQPDHTFLDQPGDFSCLKDATSLRTLILDGRLVNDFSFLSSCTNLREVSLSHTGITDLFPLFGLKNLKKLTLLGCPDLILDKDTILWMQTIPQLYLDPQQSAFIFEKSFTTFLGQCQNLGVNPVLRTELTSDPHALELELNSPRNAQAEMLFALDSFDFMAASAGGAGDAEAAKNELEPQPSPEQQQMLSMVQNPLSTEVMPSELAFYFRRLSFIGTHTYLQFLKRIKEWDGTAADTHTQIWLLTAQGALNHPLPYPWLEDFRRYGVQQQLYLNQCQEIGRANHAVFMQMLELVTSAHPPVSAKHAEQQQQALIDEIQTVAYSMPYRNEDGKFSYPDSAAIEEDAAEYDDDFDDDDADGTDDAEQFRPFATFDPQIQDQLFALFKQLQTRPEQPNLTLAKFWRKQLPFLVTYQPDAAAAAAAGAAENAASAPAPTEQSLKQNNHSLLELGYSIYLLDVESGAILRMVPDTKLKAEQVAPNLIYFMYNWPQILLAPPKPDQAAQAAQAAQPEAKQGSTASPKGPTYTTWEA